jgi:hypothetical protein
LRPYWPQSPMDITVLIVIEPQSLLVLVSVAFLLKQRKKR